MTTTKQATPNKPPESSSPPAEDALRKALSAQPDATAADLAVAAKLGRSTASKTLARLEQAGQVRRREGGRDSGRRLPDRWTLTPTQPAPDAASEKNAASIENATPASNGDA
jgi:DNA-binding MarR family transcriptional regulator